MRVLGRWLLYSVAGFVVLLMATGAGGDIGSGEPKGSWRSILLSFANTIAALAGALVWYARDQGGSLGDYWPAASIVSWVVAGAFAVGAWFSIAADLRRERRR